MAIRTLLIDTRWFVFVRVFLLCLLAGSAWYAWLPISALMTIETPEQRTFGGIGEGGESSGLGITELFHRATGGSAEGTPHTFRYVPHTGSFFTVDLIRGEVTTYTDGVKADVFGIVQSPAPKTQNALKEGRFYVADQRVLEVSTLALVHLPHYVRFGDRFAFHGPPTDAQGVPLAGEYVGGSILLSARDAESLYRFATTGVEVHVRLDVRTPPYIPYTSLVVRSHDTPATSAVAYAIADLARGQVVLEKNADRVRSIASITKLVTAVVAGTRITGGGEVSAPRGDSYSVGDLLYPLLLRSDNVIAERLAAHVGTRTFMGEMNAYVRDIGMTHTSFADASGLSAYNRSTARELVTLSRHLFMEKRYILDMSKVDTMTITGKAGTVWSMTNQNKLAGDRHFVGGKLGFTDEAMQTSLAIFTVPVGREMRTIAIVVLGSADWKQDTRTLLRWVLEHVEVGEGA